MLMKSALPQANCKIQVPIPATPRTSNSTALFLAQRCDAPHFILNEAAQNSALALH
jgi:hypothetical protein